MDDGEARGFPADYYRRMRSLPRSGLALVLPLLAACAFHRGTARPTPVILVSIDGFRYDFLDRGVTPVLVQLAASGVVAPLVPVFPSKTFPNHYTIVTGLYVEDHGIVGNTMYDPTLDAWFSMSDRRAVQDARWYGGEPIWVTAERQGVIAAPLLWPGSEAPIGGRHATYWVPFKEDLPEADRVDVVLGLLSGPPETRPRFATVYFDAVDEASHDQGPDGAAVDSALRAVDRAVGRLLDGLADLAIEANVLIVSDHGVVATSRDRVIFLDDYLDLAEVEVVDRSPVLQLRASPGRLDAVYQALHGKHPRLAVYWRDDLPARFRFRNHPRIAPIVAVADAGWEIGTHADFARSRRAFTGGQHGYDPANPSMHGILLAHGPAFASGIRAAPLQNVHLYQMLARLLGVEPAPNDGSPDSTRALLRSDGPRPTAAR